MGRFYHHRLRILIHILLEGYQQEFGCVRFGRLRQAGNGAERNRAQAISHDDLL
jgi:hypothetical protein